MRNIILAVLLFLPTLASAKCMVPRGDITTVADRIQWVGPHGEPQYTAPVQIESAGVIASEDDESQFDGDVEAFIRPEEDGVFPVLPIPLFMVDLKNGRDTIYLCAHYDSDQPKNTEVIIYFLRYNRIRPITPKPLPIGGINEIFKDRILRRTPLRLIRIPLSIAEKVQEIAMNIIGDITSIGVDRIRITDEAIELYSGGDVLSFDSYLFKKSIPLKSDE